MSFFFRLPQNTERLCPGDLLEGALRRAHEDLQSLNLSSTCNELKNQRELKPFFIAEQYMEKTAKPCWEDIVIMLCDVFQAMREAHRIAEKYDLDFEKLCSNKS